MSVGRLAPTPSGDLHLGNVLAFGAAWLSVRQVRGKLLFRNEDVDPERSRRDVAARQKADLEWLGLDWDEEMPAQSTRSYDPWLSRLGHRTYFCACTRSEIRESGGHDRSCRDRGLAEGAVRYALPDKTVVFVDRRHGRIEVDLSRQEDPILRRRDGVWNYPLAVVADDVADGVTEVVRGGDLLSFTAVQMVLWEDFGKEPPTWMHTPMVLGADRKKLSKSHRSTEVRALRDAGWSRRRVWATVLPWLGLPGDDPHAVTGAFDPRGGDVDPVVWAG